MATCTARRFAELFWRMSGRSKKGRFGPLMGLVLPSDGGNLDLMRVKQGGRNEVSKTPPLFPPLTLHPPSHSSPSLSLFTLPLTLLHPWHTHTGHQALSLDTRARNLLGALDGVPGCSTRQQTTITTAYASAKPRPPPSLVVATRLPLLNVATALVPLAHHCPLAGHRVYP